MNSSTIKATIIEAGNGLPGVGDLVYDSDGNTVYKVVATNGRISTNGPGAGNSIEAMLVEADETDPTAYSDEDWAQVSDCRVNVAEETTADRYSDGSRVDDEPWDTYAPGS